MDNANEGSECMSTINTAGNPPNEPITQMDFARAGKITPQMRTVAEHEGRDPEYIRERVAGGPLPSRQISAISSAASPRAAWGRASPPRST